MIKLPITYKNFDDDTVTEDHYFHLSKSELIDMESGNGEAMTAKLERVGKSGDGAQIMRAFREIIAAAYGQRVDGSGSQFYKDPDLTKRFMGSLAFDQLLEDLLLNTTNAVDFVNGIMPAGLEELAAKVGNRAVQDVPLPAGAHTTTQADGTVRVHPSLKHKQQYEASGLTEPYDQGGELVPWAFREPTDRELLGMSKEQMQDAFRRKNSGWKPPAPVPA